MAARLRNNLEKAILGLLVTGTAGGVGTIIYLKKVEHRRLKIDLHASTEENNPSNFLAWFTPLNTVLPSKPAVAATPPVSSSSTTTTTSST